MTLSTCEETEMELDRSELIPAYRYIEAKNNRTPLLPFGEIHKDGYTVNLWAKMDTLNAGGSFKDRGSGYLIHKAVNSGVLNIGDTVVTASAGNHAKGVARAAAEHGLNSKIFMSESTPPLKIEGTKALGGDVELVDGSYNDAAKLAEEFSRNGNLFYIPAYAHPDVMVGQSTVATEILIQMFKRGIHPDFFIAPFGGGGLTNGCGFALDDNEFHGGGKTHVYGVQARNFNTMFRSFKAGELLSYVESGDTIADGIRVPHASEEMLRLSQRYLDDMFDVTEEEIRGAIRRVYRSEFITTLQQLPVGELEYDYGFHYNHRERVPLMNRVEGAAAAAFACAFSEDRIPYGEIAEKACRKEINGVVVASGNNIDQNLLDEILSEE